ncbi:uncharacterized protein [Aristolochia californica]|uniref:uncharacterized protein isoform X2 n=1 Tax=Aristolochia californica TaxID=171875 RepID=UPI0035D7FE9D
MGVEKQGSKGVGGFFQLFDWNGKSRKKLFANKSDLPDRLKQGKEHDENLPATRFRLSEDDENGGVSSCKGGSDYSCASSVTDDEVSGVRAPSVVARLMGLDSLPTSTVSEPHSDLLYESRALRDSQYQRKTHEFLNDYRTTISTHQSYNSEGFSREIVEPKPQKIQSRLIERFQSEPLPPKSAKSVPITHHKLLSPIKTPGFISPKSAAHIMEAAAKILERGLQAGPKGKLPVLGSSSGPITVRDLKESTSTSRRPLRLPEVSKRIDESNAVKMLKGQSLNKSWNGSEETPILRASDMEDTHSVGSKSKGKSVSLAVQAKVNVQRREGLSSGTKGSSSRKEEDDFRSKQPAKNIQSTLENKQNKSSGSVVHRQNNLKQNCGTNREKVPFKPSVSNQHGRKVLSGDSSSAGRSKTLLKVPVNSRGGGYRKEGSKIPESERELTSSRTKNLPRKKRAVEVDIHGEKSGFIGTNLVNRDQKTGQSRVTINEHTSCAEDSGRSGMDVVSFTFTSPMVKPLSGSQSSGQMVEKRENLCYVGSQGDKSGSNARNKKPSSLSLNVIGGDALSVLLEQKLRELTSGLEASCNDTMKTGNATTSASILQDLISALNTRTGIPGHSEKKTLLPQNDQLTRVSNSSCFSTNSQATMPHLKLQGVGERTDCSSSSDIHKEFDYQHPSPVSILEASFSSESCNSTESSESIIGYKQDSSTLAQRNSNFHYPEKIAVMEAEAELSDSASSAHSEGTDRELGHIATENQEMEYVRVIVSHAEIMLKNPSLSHTREIVDSPLFEKLENEKFGSRSHAEEDKEAQLRRKSLFDCVRECLNMKYNQYMKGGYREWAQGMVMLRSKKLAEEAYKEVLGWRSMGDWMVDELVDWDMSTGLGRWTHYEAEGLEIGLDIENQILCSLIDEVVASLRS